MPVMPPPTISDVGVEVAVERREARARRASTRATGASGAMSSACGIVRGMRRERRRKRAGGDASSRARAARAPRLTPPARSGFESADRVHARSSPRRPRAVTPSTVGLPPARERRRARVRGDAAHHAARGAALRPRPHRLQAGLRQGRLRRLHGGGGRRAGAGLHHAGARLPDGPRGHAPSRALAARAAGRTRSRTRSTSPAARSAASARPGMLMSAWALLEREPEPDARRDRARALRQPVPLHRLHEDLRGGRAGGARAARARRGAREPARRDERRRRDRDRAGDGDPRRAARCRSEERLTPPAWPERAHRRRRTATFRVIGKRNRKVEGLAKVTGPRDLRRRHRAAAHAARQAPAQHPRARAHPSRSTRRAALAMPGVHAVITGKRPARALRHHPVDARTSRRCARTRRATSATRSPRWRPTASCSPRRRCSAIGVDYEVLPAVIDIDDGARAPRVEGQREGAARATSRSTSTSSSATSTAGSRRATWWSRASTGTRARRTRRSSRTARSADFDADRVPHASGRARRSRTTCTATSPRCSGCRPSASA